MSDFHGFNAIRAGRVYVECDHLRQYTRHDVAQFPFSVTMSKFSKEHIPR